jgi:nicotinate-nucleotide pyrophosphorylase (carboxylating)
VIDRALAEDTGRGDPTTEALVPDDLRAVADVVLRERGVVCGLEVAREVVLRLDPDAVMDVLVGDGEEVTDAPATVARIEGSARAVLTAERTALNLLQRLSGIATATHTYVAAVRGTGVEILDTRKTAPGLRRLDKLAVACGGGTNHRSDLAAAILIKDNHIAVAGGIRAVLERARAAAGHLVKIEIEVDSLAQLREVLDCGLADVVLLDNFDVASMREAVRMVGGRLVLEASGGITLDSIEAIAATGVDYASSGALTHSAPALDTGLDIEM